MAAGGVPDISLAVVTQIHNDADIITEWLEFYMNQGVQLIYIVDDRSDDDTQKRIAAFRETHADVEIVYEDFDSMAKRHGRKRSRANNVNQSITMNCIAKDAVHRGYDGWICFLDSDEYAWTPKHATLVEAISHFDSVGKNSIFVPWLVFGSNGLIKQPERIVDSFIKRVSYDEHNRTCMKHFCKISIVDLEKDSGTPHGFRVRKDVSQCVKSNHQPLPPEGYTNQVKIMCERDINAYEIVINHYVVMSKERFHTHKGSCTRKYMNIPRDEAYFEKEDTRASVVTDCRLRDKTKLS
jgi:glycosyltransferase involved in cell wall biosynthesis